MEARLSRLGATFCGTNDAHSSYSVFMLKMKEDGADQACIATDEGELVKATYHMFEDTIKPLHMKTLGENEQWSLSNLPTYEHNMLRPT